MMTHCVRHQTGTNQELNILLHAFDGFHNLNEEFLMNLRISYWNVCRSELRS